MFDLSDPVAFALVAWGTAGSLVAAGFLLFGFDRVDPGAHKAYAVRPLLVPGLIMLWPLVVWRWIALSKKGT